MTEGWSIQINGREIQNRLARVALLAGAHLAVALTMVIVAIVILIMSPVMAYRMVRR